MSSTSKPINILLVEDDEIDIQSVERALKKLNLTIHLHVAKTGIEALEKLYGKEDKRHIIPTPQLIILDINMPQMNGIEFLRKIRSDEKFNFINVLVFTTSNDQKDKITALKLNVAGYLLKPLRPDDFLPLCKLLLETA